MFDNLILVLSKYRSFFMTFKFKYLADVILTSILFDYLYRILKFLRNTNAMTAQAAGKDNEGVLLAGIQSGLIAVAIALLILGLQYLIQLGFLISSGARDLEGARVEYFNA